MNTSASNIFFYSINVSEHNQSILDVMMYASHLDPQLKGNVTLLIGNFVRSALKAAKGNFKKWTITLGFDSKGNFEISELKNKSM